MLIDSHTQEQESSNFYENLSEKETLKLAIDGDREAFGVLYELYVGRIYNYVYYRTGNTRDAEDLTARVFFRALRHIVNYQDRGLPLSAWFYRIAHNLVANWYRDNSRRKEIRLNENIPFHHMDEHPEDKLLQSEERDELLKVIRGLPADRQQLLILKFAEGLPNAKIGQIMGRSEGAIKSLYHRTLISLRETYRSKKSSSQLKKMKNREKQ